jgi:hypothetical protein
MSWQHNSLNTGTGNLFAANRESIRGNSEIPELNRVSGIDVRCDAYGHPVRRLASLKRRASPLIPQLPTNRCVAASEVIGQGETFRPPRIRFGSTSSASHLTAGRRRRLFVAIAIPLHQVHKRCTQARSTKSCAKNGDISEIAVALINSTRAHR